MTTKLVCFLEIIVWLCRIHSCLHFNSLMFACLTSMHFRTSGFLLWFEYLWISQNSLVYSQFAFIIFQTKVIFSSPLKTNEWSSFVCLGFRLIPIKSTTQPIQFKVLGNLKNEHFLENILIFNNSVNHTGHVMNIASIEKQTHEHTNTYIAKCLSHLLHRTTVHHIDRFNIRNQWFGYELQSMWFWN